MGADPPSALLGPKPPSSGTAQLTSTRATPSIPNFAGRPVKIVEDGDAIPELARG